MVDGYLMLKSIQAMSAYSLISVFTESDADAFSSEVSKENEFLITT
jgi:hypothetical protein